MLRVTFQHRAPGPYGAAEVREDFGEVELQHGVGGGAQSRLLIVHDAERGPVLRVRYPRGAVGPQMGGAEFKVRLPEAGDELTCAYRVRFGEDFDFVRGGKLPGLAGGAAPTGGQVATGSNGFSARLMWRPGGAVVQYVYHPDKRGEWGDDFAYTTEPSASGTCAQGAARQFSPGRWHRVMHRVRLNTPGARDGRIQAWFDGALALDVSGLRFRDVPSVRIDQLHFSTFFGGNEASWAPTKDEHVDFDEFVVAPSLPMD